jgi:hypothetical protein
LPDEVKLVSGSTTLQSGPRTAGVGLTETIIVNSNLENQHFLNLDGTIVVSGKQQGLTISIPFQVGDFQEKQKHGNIVTGDKGEKFIELPAK